MFFLCSQYSVFFIPNIITYLPNPLPSVNEKFSHAPNPMPYPECLYLSKSVAFLVNLTASNKEIAKVKSVLGLNGHKFIS